MVNNGSRSRQTRQQKRVSKTRQKLVDAARVVFAEKGLDLTRIDDITERADVGKGTFYYHFGTKERLVRAMIKSTLGELDEAIGKKCTGITDLTELLDSLIDAHMQFFSNRWEDFVLYYQGRADLMLQEGYSGIETPFFEYLERIESLLGAAIQHRVPKPALRRIAFAIAGFLSGYYSFAAISSEEENIDETFRGLRGAMVAGLARFIKEAMSKEAAAAGSNQSN
jgi:AcrR family transcriptional regulator